MRKKIVVLIVASVLGLWLSVALAVGILGDGQGSGGSGGDQPDTIFSEPDEPMPPAPTESKYLSEIDNEEYPPATAPATPPDLRWDFSRKRVLAYDYTQKVDNWLQMFGSEMTQKTALSGLFILKCNGDRTATMLFKNVKVKTTISGTGEESPKTSESELPPIVEEGVREDGETDAPNEEGMFSAVNDLFPLPKKTLRVGEVFENVETKPLSANGMQIKAERKTTVKLAGYVVIGGRVCARLETTTDIILLEPPPQINGDVALTAKGKGVYYFDLEGKQFVSGSLAFIIAMRAEIQPPNITSPDGDPSQEIQTPIKMRFVMDSDNLIKMKFNPSATDTD